MNKIFQMVLESQNKRGINKTLHAVDPYTHKQIEINLEDFVGSEQQTINKTLQVAKNRNKIISFILNLAKQWNPDKEITKEQVNKDFYMYAIRFVEEINLWEAFYRTSYFRGHDIVYDGKNISLAG